MKNNLTRLLQDVSGILLFVTRQYLSMIRCVITYLHFMKQWSKNCFCVRWNMHDDYGKYKLVSRVKWKGSYQSYRLSFFEETNTQEDTTDSKKNESLHIDTSHSEMTDLARILSHPPSNDWTDRSSYWYLYYSSMCIVFTQKTDTYEQIRTQNRELH